ncbi:MAG: TATA-box-binding protein [Candidatus Heimdallarchaeota archaeon LC_2]|nr:MAG: TATA-box-binding protein [Candidatus Heimdallarchaeota archaeon LC_2]
MTKKKETTKKLSKKEAKKIADEAAALIANENRIPTPSEIKNEEDGLIFKIIIQNCVASVNLFTSINLVSIYQQLIDDDVLTVSFNPEQFPGLILKTKNPKISSLVFSSGKLVITGAKSTDMVHEAVYVVMGILRDSGTTIDEDPEIIVQNIVASGNFNKRTINLELASMWLESSMYEPEQFPGLIYRLPIPKTVLLLFQSGNLVCTGAKTEDQVHEAVRKTYDDLDEIEAFDT